MANKTSIRSVGSYTLEHQIGHNNISAVYRASHATGEVALRMFLTDDRAIQQRFLQEIEKFAWLDHPYVIPILDSGATDKHVYVAMPYLEGGALKQRLKKRQILENHTTLIPPDSLPALHETAEMLVQVAAGLDYLHANNIVHHNIQPTNIMFDGQGRAFVADTGLAKILKIVFSLRDTNALGTHPYSAPEQWQGDTGGAASDQYALACIAYELVTGRPLFEASSIFKLMNMHMNEFLIPPHHVRPGIPASLTVVLVRALAKSPDERYPSVVEFAEHFQRTVSNISEAKTDFFTFDPTDKSPSYQHQVFIGHCERDITAMHTLTGELRKRGISAWDAPSPGTLRWKSALRQAILSSENVVILLSPGAMFSDWVEMMIRYAQRHEKPIYGVKLSGEHPHRGVFKDIIDANDDYARGVDTLAAIIKAAQTGDRR